MSSDCEGLNCPSRAFGLFEKKENLPQPPSRAKLAPRSLPQGGEYDLNAADVNKDSSITIADVTALVNIILGK